MPSKEKRITLVVYPETLKLIQETADQAGMSMSSIGRRAIELGIEQMRQSGLVCSHNSLTIEDIKEAVRTVLSEQKQP